MTKPSTTEFELVSTLHFDASCPEEPIYMSEYHKNRLIRAATNFGWTDAVVQLQDISFETFLREHVDDFLKKAQSISSPPILKLRVLVTAEAEISVTVTPTTTEIYTKHPSQLNVGGENMEQQPLLQRKDVLWRIIVDTMPTPVNEFTRHKTSRRDMYNAARARVDVDGSNATETSSGRATSLADVLMYNHAMEVTETSLCTVYLFRNGQWVTPPVYSGGQQGTTRQWAIDHGLCVAEVVLVDSLVEGEKVWVSNGLRGFVGGVLDMSRYNCKREQV